MTKKAVSSWARALFLAQKGKEQTERGRIAVKLVQILKDRRKERFLPKILEESKRIQRREEGISLIFGAKQEPSVIKKVKLMIPNIFKADGAVEVKTDEKIIGGFRLETENFLIKASVKDFLDYLKAKVL
ncbi:MAG: F0F1 ATP synthase subunit delta [bacterium]